MQQNRIEKIVQQFVVKHDAPVHSGNYVMIRSKQILTHDNTRAVIPKFKRVTTVADVYEDRFDYGTGRSRKQAATAFKYKEE